MTEREKLIEEKRAADKAESAKLGTIRKKLKDGKLKPEEREKLELAASKSMHALSRLQEDAYESLY